MINQTIDKRNIILAIFGKPSKNHTPVIGLSLAYIGGWKEPLEEIGPFLAGLAAGIGVAGI